MTTADAKVELARLRQDLDDALALLSFHGIQFQQFPALEASHSLTEAITPEMIEAGALALIEKREACSPRASARAIYTAMQAARPIAPVQDDDAEWLRETVANQIALVAAPETPWCDVLEAADNIMLANRLARQS